MARPRASGIWLSPIGSRRWIFFEKEGAGDIAGRICWWLGFQQFFDYCTDEGLAVERGFRAVDDVSASRSRLDGVAFQAHPLPGNFEEVLERSDGALRIAEELGDERLLRSEVLFRPRVAVLDSSDGQAA